MPKTRERKKSLVSVVLFSTCDKSVTLRAIFITSSLLIKGTVRQIIDIWSL